MLTVAITIKPAMEIVKGSRVRRPRGSLSREAVVEAALRLSDRDGLEALSMPGLAREIGCGVMTIYGYVEGKEDLLAAVAQRGLRDLDLRPPLPPTAEGVLGAWGRALRRTMLLHPSLPLIFLSRAVTGPGILRGMEVLLGTLERVGLPPAEGVHAVYAVLVYVTGFVAWELPRTVLQPQSAYAESWRRELALLPPSELPRVAGAASELPLVAGEAQFELGLNALVAGLGTGSSGSPAPGPGGRPSRRSPRPRARSAQPPSPGG